MAKNITISNTELTVTEVGAPELQGYILSSLGEELQRHGWILETPPPQVFRGDDGSEQPYPPYELALTPSDEALLVRENPPRTIPLEALLVGIVATRPTQRREISNSEIFNSPNLDFFLNVRERILNISSQRSIPVSSTDLNNGIDLSRLGENQLSDLLYKLSEILERETPARGNIKTLSWLTHDSFKNEHRKLKLLRIGLTRNNDGEIVILFEPDKKYAVIPTDMALLLRATQEIHNELELSSNSTQANQEIRATEKGIRRAIYAGILRYMNLPLPQNNNEENIGPISQQVQQLIREYGRMFEDPQEAFYASKLMSKVFAEFIRSGGWLSAPHLFGAGIFSALTFDIFSRKLSETSEPFRDLQTLAQVSDILSALVMPTIPGKQETLNTDSQKAKQKKQNKISPSTISTEPPSNNILELLDRYGRPIREGTQLLSVLGIAQMLGLKDRITSLLSSNEIYKRNSGVYGTTDFANPVEAIMAHVAGKKVGINNIEYFLSEGAHTPGSYLQRIGIPSAITRIGSEEDIVYLINLANQITDPDTKMTNILEIFKGTAVEQYYLEIINNLRLDTNISFKNLYRYMNTELCASLGIECKWDLEDSRLRELTIQDILDRIELIGHKAYEAQEALFKIVENVQGFDIKKFKQSILGKEGHSWSARTRKFLKRISDVGEEYIDITSIPENRSLGSLMDEGYVLTGDGWVVCMPLIYNGDVAILHKNTRSGSNYCAGIIGDDLASAIVSPVVRLVPQGENSGATGDGLDIGMYFLEPGLIDCVKKELVNEEPRVVGGIEQIVMTYNRPSVWINGKKVSLSRIGINRSNYTGGNITPLHEIIL